MASILDRYGIKEVSDVTFYKIQADGSRGDPVLFLDTLKISTVEQTADEVFARGGKGNAKLVGWDYNKEITVSIQDALFSAKSMAIMFGNGSVRQGSSQTITKTARVLSAGNKLPDYFIADIYDATNGSVRTKVYMGSESTAPAGMVKFADAHIGLTKVVDEAGTELKNETSSITTTTLWQGATAVTGTYYYVVYTTTATTKEIEISADAFPGTYYVQGDTYCRSDVNGDDQFFQFIIPKAKMSSEHTITMEADGDPAVFDMNLTVMRPDDGMMMKLVQYDLSAS